jgi:PucR C-terminal helix-turn-helix domain/GGDEF-like domain
MGVDAVVGEVARLIDADLPELTTEMTGWFIEVIPEFRHDDTVRRLMIASTSSNLVAIVDMLAHNIPIDRITVPPAAAEYARRFAQHDLSLEALLRAYRLGEHRFVQWALQRVGGLEIDTAAVLAGIADLSERVNRYVDQVIEGLIDIYESERRRWDSRTGAARAAQLRLVLDNENLSTRSAQDLIEVQLDGWHQAVIAWVDLDAPDPARALQTVSRMLLDTTGRAPTTTLADDRTMWAWTSSPTAPPLDPVLLLDQLPGPSSLRLALGSHAWGLAGFRSTFREALRARAVAEASPTAGRVVAFDDVAIAALLTDHLPDLRTWVRRVLGSLADDTESAARLRDTVRIFLQNGSSYTEAAARMHMHKNTVHYRVRKAEEIRGRPFTDGRLDVEIALLASELLGSTIVPATGSPEPD